MLKSIQCVCYSYFRVFTLCVDSNEQCLFFTERACIILHNAMSSVFAIDGVCFSRFFSFREEFHSLSVFYACYFKFNTSIFT